MASKASNIADLLRVTRVERERISPNPDYGKRLGAMSNPGSRSRTELRSHSGNGGLNRRNVRAWILPVGPGIRERTGGQKLQVSKKPQIQTGKHDAPQVGWGSVVFGPWSGVSD